MDDGRTVERSYLFLSREMRILRFRLNLLKTRAFNSKKCKFSGRRSPCRKSFLAWSQRCIARLTRNFEWGKTHVTWAKLQFWKFKIADARHFQKWLYHMILTLIKQQIKMLIAPQLITATQHTDKGKVTNGYK